MHGLCGRAGVVVVTAAASSATILTSDPGDLRCLSNRLPTPVPIRHYCHLEGGL